MIELSIVSLITMSLMYFINFIKILAHHFFYVEMAVREVICDSGKKVIHVMYISEHEKL